MELLKEIYNTNDVEVQVGAASTKATNVQVNKYVIMVLAFLILVQQPSQVS